jgi:HTH-type transcriptional regulator, competence development regulator
MENLFGPTMRQLRREKGISQRQLAEGVGVDFSYISKVENGRLPPPAADTVEAICQFLGVPSERLLALTGKVTSTVTEMLGSSQAAQTFMQKAKHYNITEREWDELSLHLSRLREEDE